MINIATKTSMTTPPAGYPSGGNTQTTIDKQKNIYYTPKHKHNTINNKDWVVEMVIWYTTRKVAEDRREKNCRVMVDL